MWGPLSPIVLWLLRSMISVDAFFVTVLGPPVLTGLRHRASCFLAHRLDSFLAGCCTTWTRHSSWSSPWACWHYSHTLSLFVHILISLYFTLCALLSSYFFSLIFVSVDLRAYIYISLIFMRLLYIYLQLSSFILIAYIEVFCHEFIQLDCKVAAANLS